MRIKVLKDNNRVIATGSIAGRKIKAIAVCNEDNFDENVGIDLATRKYKIREKMAKRDSHKAAISSLNKLIAWCENQKEAEENLVALHNQRIAEMEQEYNDHVASLFK
jgi:hypothetical protein